MGSGGRCWRWRWRCCQQAQDLLAQLGLSLIDLGLLAVVLWLAALDED